METMNLSTILVPFLMATMLTVFLLLAFESSLPVIKQDHNFIPMSTTFPKDSPDHISKSCSTLTRCVDGSCKHCDPSYKCTEIAADEKVYLKGERVPSGEWCLPPGKANVACGPATGRAVWTGEEWKCVCLYPDMYGGKDCTDSVACKASNAQGFDQSGNVLVHRDTGLVYDVADTSTTPYDVDANGSPLYVCKCDSSKTKKFVSLPQDPFRCHLDPCSLDHEIPFWNAEKESCECTANGAVNNEYALSNVTNQCIRTPQCAWDDKNQRCLCPEGQVSFTCDSQTMKRTDGNAPPCPNVPGGSFCKNPCEGFCLNGGIGTIKGDKCVCQCPDNPTIEFQGARCENPCNKSGVKEPNLRCCSGKKQKKYIPNWGTGPTQTYWQCA